MARDATEDKVSRRGLVDGSLDEGRAFNMSDCQSYVTEAWAVRLSWVMKELLMSTTLYFLHRIVERR